MTRLSPQVYLDHLVTESARFRDVLADCDPAARVPACPDWDASDLLWHLGAVQWFWARMIAKRPGPPTAPEDDAPERPDEVSGLLAFFDRASHDLAAGLAAADPSEPAWSWAPEQTVGFTHRRQAHEALIHRVDAEQAAGVTSALDPALAADGVAELMEVMYGGRPPAWGRFEPRPGELTLEITDAATTIRVRPGHLTGIDPESGDDVTGPHLLVVPESSAPPAATIRGTAADLDTWLWRRRDDARITVTGDEASYGAFRAAVDQPID